MKSGHKHTVGSYLAARLEQIGIEHFFTVPGDYNLILLDEFIKNTKLRLIGCCNELNAGYAADGYARINGIATVVVTYSVGGLSVINAVAGAYAEDLPVIVISGAPGTNAEFLNQTLHHTLGKVDYRYMQEIYRHVTIDAVRLTTVEETPYLVDQAIEKALRFRKPVYIEVPCNIAGLELPKPIKRDFKTSSTSDPHALKKAVEHAASFLNRCEKPVLVAGANLRPWQAIKAFQELADAAKYAVASMADAKGIFPETNPHFIGIYWGSVSSPGCGEVVESSDGYLFAGGRFTDYSTVGYSNLIDPEKMVLAEEGCIKLEGQSYTGVGLKDFLTELAPKIKANVTSFKAYSRIKGEAPAPAPSKQSDTSVSTRYLFAQIQKMLDANSVVVTETGDSWFNSMRLKLPQGCQFEIQMQYGSIGWSVGAVLGCALASKSNTRVIGLIGDGSFQLTAQEVSTMIRNKLPIILFIINNSGYTIEAQIHDGPYNVIGNWHYAKLIDVLTDKQDQAWGVRVKTEGELQKAIAKAQKSEGLSLIEVMIDRDDCNKSLLEWGSRVSHYNGRPPLLQS